MAADFLTIAITPERVVAGEARVVTDMLRGAPAHGVRPVDYVHLRHPGLSATATRRLLRAIPESLRCRVKLHDHPEVACELGAGYHVNSRTPAAWQPSPGMPLSRSCHSLQELHECAGNSLFIYDYVTLSPIYPSISKPGYCGTFRMPELTTALRELPLKVVALGGVTPERFAELRRAGFAGGAMLGHIAWPESEKMLQFITDGEPQEIVPQVEAALEGGINWVQLRMKGQPRHVVKEVGRRVKRLCHLRDVMLIINDDPGMAQALGADGVHLGKNDMDPRQARLLLGPKAIIGATANSLSDLRALYGLPIDYIGLGPVHFTGTKKNLAPVMGVEGVAQLLATIRAEGCVTPVVAIGGLTPEDVRPLLRAGADGIAVSGAIAHAPDGSAAAETFIRKILNTDDIPLSELCKTF